MHVDKRTRVTSIYSLLLPRCGPVSLCGMVVGTSVRQVGFQMYGHATSDIDGLIGKLSDHCTSTFITRDSGVARDPH